MNRYLAVALACAALLWGADTAADKFKAKLPGDLQIAHALSRLTFGARPGDADAVKKLGLKKWIDRQLHPAALPQNAQLEEKLAGLKTLRLSAPEMAVAYPPPQVIKAMAEGKLTLPEDPEQRERLSALVAVYQRRQGGAPAKLTPAQRKSLLLNPPPGQTVASGSRIARKPATQRR